MSNVTVQTLLQKKQNREKFAALTAYDSTQGHLVSTCGVEVILVGDSLGNVCQGLDSTLPVTVDDMCYHTRAVARGNKGALLIADLPFASYANKEDALINAARLMREGAHMVKVEGDVWLAPIVEHLREQGIPVCVHLGLTPQSVHILGGYKVQGREQEKARAMFDAALTLQTAGASLLVLECVPSDLASQITHELTIPVIGIGAGVDTDGQILVLYDMLDMTEGRRPKFVKNYMEGATSTQHAIQNFVAEVKEKTFPSAQYSFE